jgi:hypothetical protein
MFAVEEVIGTQLLMDFADGYSDYSMLKEEWRWMKCFRR